MSSGSDEYDRIIRERDAQDLRDRIAEDTLLMLSRICLKLGADPYNPVDPVPHRSEQLVRELRGLTGRWTDSGERG